MSHRRLHFCPLLTSLVTAVLLLGAESTVALESASTLLTDQPVVRAKAPSVISPEAQSFLAKRGDAPVRVWVLFTDKGVRSAGEFSSQAAATELPDRVRQRRAKMDRDRILFVDLPVVADYIGDITAAGATHRRTSRWLNAASFDIAPELLDDIASLPFVAEIRPVAMFRRDLPEISGVRFDTPAPQALAPDALNYGYATDQINQINVPAVHDKGFNGAGITLAIFDTGYRKTHEAFANAYAEGRVLAEWDFVFNDGNTDYEAGIDWSSSTSHGTMIWSVSAGYMPGRIIGPAYKANILLAKTEDVRDETQVEEDNWVAALEWADNHGADVITSSLGYADWYTYANMDGQTAVTTVAANTAAGLGIVVCNSMGNAGPGAGTLSAPADAHDIVSVGAVDLNNVIASFSSRGPTYDGRIKPEVVARGVSTAAGVNSSDIGYGSASGTSLSTPLVAGVAVLLVQAHPEFTPQMIRQSLMETADRAGAPGNNYGWGLIDADDALGWGVVMAADETVGQAPKTIQFTGGSGLNPTSWKWHFGDGDSAMVQNPSHVYENPGAYTVSLTVETPLYGALTAQRQNFIVLLGDTTWYGTDSTFAGDPLVVSIRATTSQPLNRLIVPLTFDSADWLTLDSVRLGERTAYFERLSETVSDPVNRRFVFSLTANNGGGAPPLEPGSGEILKAYFTTDEYAFGGQSTEVDSINAGNPITFIASYLTYAPAVHPGSAALITTPRGDANHDLKVAVNDLTYLIEYFYKGGPDPVTLQAGDANRDFGINISDITFLVNYLFKAGPAPANP